MRLDDREFVADLCAERAGLKVDPGKPYLIESRLAPVARREGFDSVEALLAAVREPAADAQAWAVVEALAQAESRFFRDREVFEALWRETAPDLARRRGDNALRIWSAGCGAGQEIYSLAMLQDERPLPGGQAELFASDLGERQLERAQAGRYTVFEVQRGLAARQLVRHFENREDGFLLNRRIRDQVRWRRVNLMDDLRAFGRFDVVLCRYVLSAMTEAARGPVLDRLLQALAPDGVLVLGVDEACPAGDLAPVAGVPGAYRRSGAVRVAA